MERMFEHAESFNQPIGDWDVSNVKDMTCMFDSAKSFNQDLSSWQLKPRSRAAYIFDNCPIKKEYRIKRNNRRL
jgi:MoxR-like ATPase